MAYNNSNDSMLEMYLFETSQNIEQLEQSILSGEKTNGYDASTINEIFRIMHTIKGSSAMMMFNDISTLAHAMEDLFFLIREHKPQEIDYSQLSDLILEGIDFIKVELHKIRNGKKADADSSQLIKSIKEFLELIKKNNNISSQAKKPQSKKQQYYIFSENALQSQLNNFKATIFFEEDCQMENIRAYTVIHDLKELAEEIHSIPSDIMENEDSTQIIQEKGLVLYFKTAKEFSEIDERLKKTIFLKSLELIQLEDDKEFQQFYKEKQIVVEELPVKVPKVQEVVAENQQETAAVTQSMISVNVAKLDKLMDLVGEMVIAEAMVVQNPDLKGLQLENFNKSARQLHKITSELQDMIMSIRMVPLANTFQKMHRIVRDMTRKLNKEVNIQVIGQETEVDKNIIEHISDPLMHLVRNAIDHGIEPAEERIEKNKPAAGKLILEAKNTGSEVLILVKDDGKGLNKEKILAKAKENNLLVRPESEMTDKEIFNLIFLPGFSTNSTITEFSGRGVVTDVVSKNIEAVGGTVSVESLENVGTTFILRIPLTLAIMDGMNVRVGNSRYTIPITAIKESFRPQEKDIIIDPDNNEMIMVRGNCYPILRLHEFYNVDTNIKNFSEGILIMVEQDEKSLCIFVDELLGQQQVVVKAMPEYIRNIRKIRGLAGCTLLGDGSISLILDIGGLVRCSD